LSGWLHLRKIQVPHRSLEPGRIHYRRLLASAFRRALPEDILHELAVLSEVRALPLLHVLELILVSQLQIGEVRLFVLSLLIPVSLDSAHKDIHLSDMLSLDLIQFLPNDGEDVLFQLTLLFPFFLL